jgi:hypothetical protein
LDRLTRDQIREYFSDKGPGRHIKSFASFRLGTGLNPIGILNIDSSEPGVLGYTQDYYPTFHALLAPIMAALALNVQAYAQLDFAPLEASAEVKSA